MRWRHFLFSKSCFCISFCSILGVSYGLCFCDRDLFIILDELCTAINELHELYFVNVQNALFTNAWQIHDPKVTMSSRTPYSGDTFCARVLSLPDRHFSSPRKDGQILARIWNDLSEQERHYVRWQCEKAIRILRYLGIRVLDAGKHNVLYARETEAVTMLDFEAVLDVSPSEHVPYVELELLFGDSEMRGRAIGG